jgi:hypothetical protein
MGFFPVAVAGPCDSDEDVQKELHQAEKVEQSALKA